MKTKFEPGQKVLHKGEEHTIMVAQKDFGTKRVMYLLSSGEKVNEIELGTAKVNKIDLPAVNEAPELVALRTKYEKTFKKPVSNAKNNDAEWIAKKLEEAGVTAEAETVTTAGWDVLQALDQASLEIFIKEKGLDIDLNDYDDEDSLRIVVAEELNIEIPE